MMCSYHLTLHDQIFHMAAVKRSIINCGELVLILLRLASVHKIICGYCCLKQ